MLGQAVLDLSGSGKTLRGTLLYTSRVVIGDVFVFTSG